MTGAVEEVNSVSEELKKLRDKIRQYEDASNRLNGIGDALDNLNSNIDRIKQAFNDALTQVVSGKMSVEQLVDSIPDVVKRIEASDAAVAMNELKDRLVSHEKSLDEVTRHFAEERVSHAASLHELTERIERTLAAQDSLAGEVRQIQESVSQGFEKLQNSLDNAICNLVAPKIQLTQEVIERVERVVNQLHRGMADSSAKTLPLIKKIQETLNSSHDVLIQLKNKKGWFL
jgi:chromosome segregation ATPase